VSSVDLDDSIDRSAAPAATAAPSTDVTQPPSSEAPPTEPPATDPTTAETAPPTTRATTATIPANSGPVTVQAGAFSTADAASQHVGLLAAKGFGGFTVSGGGPFRVVRGGLSGSQANALIRALGAAGVSAFIRG
jgi:cell division protein FtsN